MESFQSLQRLTELIIRHRLPKEQTIFLEIGEWNKYRNWIKNLGSSGCGAAKIDGAEPEIECDKVTYGGVTYNIVCY